MLAQNTESLFDLALDCLRNSDPEDKQAGVQTLAEKWRRSALSRAASAAPLRIDVPGRPDKPILVPPRELLRRKLATVEGHAALIHSLCHIEFNAINLALDAVYRFRDMPDAYYTDWLQVAAEEAHHFGLLRNHLITLGFDYGTFPAHNGLWEAAMETAHDVLVRMALVPRVLEARGLDVTPGIMEKLSSIGDNAAVAILDIIHRDEIGHVAIGSHWFRFLCAQRGLPTEETFADLIEKHMRGGIRKPIAHATRRQAGFTEAELAYIENAG
ncbi:MAG: ferritin-like domain-containing protein [Gammaproteobacteria bacterium]